MTMWASPTMMKFAAIVIKYNNYTLFFWSSLFPSFSAIMNFTSSTAKNKTKTICTKMISLSIHRFFLIIYFS